MARQALIDRSFSKSAQCYAKHAVVQLRVADRLLSVLTPNTNAKRVLDVGCGVGLQADSLRQRFPNADLCLVDRSPGMCDQARRLCSDVEVLQADAAHLPVADASVDCLFSSSMLQWSSSFESIFQEWHRVLKPGGLLAFSCFLDGSLQEIKASWGQVDAVSHVNDLPTMTALTEAYAALSWDCLHESTAKEVDTFSSIKEMVHSMRGVGSQTITADLKPQGLVTPARWQAFCRHYQSFQQADGLLPVSYEVAYVLIQKRG